MALLGQLTVGILGDMSGYSKSLTSAQKETVNFSKGIERMGKDISTIGYGFQDLGSKLTRSITAPALIAGTALAGITLKKGWDRLMGVDSARAKLLGLGHDTKDVDAIMENALSSVKGTSFRLDEAASAAASAVAAGIEPGKELTKYLSLAGDAAAIAGTDFNEMGSIFNKVQTSNKAYNDSLQQLSDRGLPIYQWLAKEAGVTEEAVFDMASQGEISSEMFRSAIENNIGGAAQIIGDESLGAALANVWADVSRIGASFLDGGEKGEGFFNQLKPLVTEFRGYLDNLAVTAESLGEKFGETFANVVDKVRDMKQSFDDLDPGIQSMIKKFAIFGGIGAIAIGPILLIIGKLIVLIGTTITRFGAIAGAVTKLGGVMGILTGPIGIAIGVFAALIAIGVLLYKNWETVKVKALEVFSNFGPILDNVKEAFLNLKTSVQPNIESLKGLWESLEPIFIAVGAIIAAVLAVLTGVFVAQFTAIISSIEPLFAVIANLVDIIGGAIGVIVALLMGDWAGAWEYMVQIGEATIDLFINAFMTLVTFFSTFVNTIIDFFYGLYMTLVGNSIIPDMVNAIVDWFKNMFQWLIDIVMMIVDGVVAGFNALLAGITIIMNFIREVVKTVWNAITTAVSTSVSSIKSIVNVVFDWLSAYISMSLNGWKNIITTVWNVIKTVITAAVNAVKSVVTSVFNAIRSVITSVMNSIRSVITSMWNAIKSVVTSAVNAIRSVVSNVFNAIRSVISSVMSSIRSTISSIWNSIKSTITSVVNGIKSTITSVFNSIKSTTSKVFNAVKTAMTNPIEAAKNTIKRAVDAVKGFFTNMKLKIPKISMPKLPKFSMKGNFGFKPPSVPKIGVNWNAQGGIFDKATIFNTANAGLQGFGEAGPEAILPLNAKVLGSIGEGIARTMQSSNQKGDINIYQTINSPEPLNPSETARRTKRSMQELALRW